LGFDCLTTDYPVKLHESVKAGTLR